MPLELTTRFRGISTSPAATRQGRSGPDDALKRCYGGRRRGENIPRLPSIHLDNLADHTLAACFAHLFQNPCGAETLP